MNLETITLKNQLKTHLINARGHKSTHVQIWFRAGSALENESEKGIAHFLEHMFFKGTKKRPNQKIAKDVEAFGGEINAFTSFNYTCYYINAPKDRLIEATDILLDMVSNPMFLEEDIRPEREVVFEEYRRSIDSPNQFGFLQLQKNFFLPPYDSPILGEEKTIKKFSKKQLISFRSRYYNLENAFLVISGDLDDSREELLKNINHYKLPPGKEASSFELFDIQKKNIPKVHCKKVKMAQLYLAIGAEGIESNLMPAEDLSISCLGLGESALPYKTLVLEKNLANDITASTLYFARGGIHLIKINAPTENLVKIYDELFLLLKDFIKNGPSQKEITKIKNQYSAAKIYEKESLESYTFSIGHGLALAKNPNFDDLHLEKIKKVGSSEVKYTLKKIFSKPIHLDLQIPQESDLKEHQKNLFTFSKRILDWQKELRKEKKVTNKTNKSTNDSSCKILKIQDGVELLHRHSDITPTFALQCYLQGGISSENPSNAGIHHFLSTMLTKGYSEKDYHELRVFLEERSATFNGFSGKNTYGLTLHGQTEHFEELTQHFFSALFSPDFPLKMINTEKELLLRTYKAHTEDSAKQCFKQFNRTVFAQHPYSLDLIGNEKTLPTFNKKNLSELHKKNIQKGKILFSYSGSLPSEEVFELIKENFKKLNHSPNPTIDANKQIPINNKLKNSFIYFDREQTNFILGRPAYPIGSKNDLYLKALTSFLSGQSSDLFVTVRDRLGLCYSVSPIHISALEGGYWGIYMASGHDKVKEAISAVKKILSRIQNQGLSSDELNFVKKMIHGQYLTNLETNEDYINAYSFYQFFGFTMDFYYKINENIQNIKLKEINSFLKEFLSLPFVEIIAGRDQG